MKFTAMPSWWIVRWQGILLVAAVLAVGAAAARQVWQVLRAAQAPTPVLFDHGLSALDPRSSKEWTNVWCGSCHAREYERWAQSRHSKAGINDNFRAQMLDEFRGRQQWCLNCHAPINPGLRSLPTQEPPGIDRAFEISEPWLAQGVDCLSCHVRDGLVLVTQTSHEAEQAHPIRLAPELGTAEFCGGCHQFSFKSEVLPDSMYGELQQASLEEFLEFRATGGLQERCHECHMPDADHLMPGGYSPRMLQRALGLELAAEWRDEKRMLEISVGVQARRVGHRVPGGEHLFRFLTLQTALSDADGRTITPRSKEKHLSDSDQTATDAVLVSPWPPVETIGYWMRFSDAQLQPADAPGPDTRLRPGEKRWFRYLMPISPNETNFPIRVRSELWYHVLGEDEVMHLGLSPAELTWLVRTADTSLLLDHDR